MKNIFKFNNKALSADGFHGDKSPLNNEQRGRSMVEMLGVLAIIGVLSIGGIAGYRMAMDRHKANELLNLRQQAQILFEEQKNSPKGNVTVENKFMYLSFTWDYSGDYHGIYRELNFYGINAKIVDMLNESFGDFNFYPDDLDFPTSCSTDGCGSTVDGGNDTSDSDYRDIVPTYDGNVDFTSWYSWYCD